MNANELADELETYDWIPDDAIWIKKAANMLRQQQAEIESLKEFAETIGGEANRKIIEQQAEIEALKLQLHTTLTNRNLRTYDGKAQEK